MVDIIILIIVIIMEYQFWKKSIKKVVHIKFSTLSLWFTLYVSILNDFQQHYFCFTYALQN